VGDSGNWVTRGHEGRKGEPDWTKKDLPGKGLLEFREKLIGASTLTEKGVSKRKGGSTTDLVGENRREKGKGQRGRIVGKGKQK